MAVIINSKGGGGGGATRKVEQDHAIHFQSLFQGFFLNWNVFGEIRLYIMYWQVIEVVLISFEHW